MAEPTLHPEPVVKPKVEKPKAKPAINQDIPVVTMPSREKQKAARGTLEQIANGAPVLETITPSSESTTPQPEGPGPASEAPAPKAEQVKLPDRETVSQLLTETNSMLLDARDKRIMLSALATQAEDTPLGNEIRHDVLRMVGSMSNDSMPPDAVIKLDALQKKIRDLNLPKPNPQESALVNVVQTYNESHPQSPIPEQVLDQIKNGNIEGAPAIAQMLQENNDLARAVWKEITLKDNFTGLSPTPDNILKLTMMDETEENKAKMQAIFEQVRKKREPVDVMAKVGPTLMIGALAIQFFSQVAMGDGGSGH